MQIQQLSGIIENKPGRMAEVTEVLAERNIDIRAISVADTRDFGILRVIVDKPQGGRGGPESPRHDRYPHQGYRGGHRR